MSPSMFDLAASVAGVLLAAAGQATIVVGALLLLERLSVLRPLRGVLVTLAIAKLATPPWIAWPAPVAGEALARAAVATAAPPVLAVPVVLVWALGSLVALVRLVAMRVRLLRALERATPCADEATLAILARVCRRLQIEALPRLLESAEAAAPFTAGARRPCIVLPSTWTRSLAASDLEHVLLHEAAHVRRRDPLRLELAAALGVLWWWNPAFHWANARWRASIEDSCDDLVLARRAAPADYCGSLLRAARLVTRGEERLAGAAGMGSGAMERRLRRLMGPPAPRSRRRAALVFLTGVLLAAATIPYLGALTAPPHSARHAAVHAWKHRAAHGHPHSHP